MLRKLKMLHKEPNKPGLELMGMTDENTVTPLWWAKK